MENIKCNYCNKIYKKTGYEYLDENNYWFCSHICDQKHKLNNYYF